MGFNLEDKSLKNKILIISLLIILLAASISALLFAKSHAKPPTAAETIAAQRYIVHAGGFIECGGEQMDYTNTYETLDNLYKIGNRVAEYDFQTTSDGCIVCAHDGDGLWARGYDFTEAPTLEEFLGTKYKGQLTTMSLEMLAEFMSAHKDFYVVTDVKDDLVSFCQHLSETYPDLKDQFIIQIYHDTGQYDPVHDMGFNNIIYTLYNTYDEERDPEVIYEFLTWHELVGVTFWDSWAIPGDPLFEAMRSSGVPMCVHTVNSADSMKEFFDLGITAIYTDVVDPALRY